MDHRAADGFARGAATYDRGRPSYPLEAVSILMRELGLTASSEVLDLAAGRGSSPVRWPGASRE